MGSDFYTQLFKKIAFTDEIQFFEGLPAGVEVAFREDNDKKLLFVLNLTREQHTLRLPFECRDVLHGKSKRQELLLESFGVEILEVTHG